MNLNYVSRIPFYEKNIIIQFERKIITCFFIDYFKKKNSNWNFKLLENDLNIIVRKILEDILNHSI